MLLGIETSFSSGKMCPSDPRLRDVELKLNKRALIPGFLLIWIGVIVTGVLSYLFSRESHPLAGVTIGSCLGACIGIIGSYWILFSQVLVKTREASIPVKVRIALPRHASKKRTSRTKI